jgi:hypothetical protein
VTSDERKQKTKSEKLKFEINGQSSVATLVSERSGSRREEVLAISDF